MTAPTPHSTRSALGGDRGSYSVETAVLAPVMLALMLLMVAFGRVVDADGAPQDYRAAANVPGGVWFWDTGQTRHVTGAVS
ncbi:TadE family protein, partial [Streptomyces sp. NPDC059651]|uniref:TadE family protein n=1 Tax=Streptomyces sp. NPDC059651 TaxID=3346897 RepID=UPI003697B4FB